MRWYMYYSAYISARSKPTDLKRSLMYIVGLPRARRGKYSQRYEGTFCIGSVQHVADVLQRTITSSPRHTEFQMHTPYFPRLRVLKDRYMRSSCKGVNSVILRIVSTFANQKKKSQQPNMTKQKNMTKQDKRKREKKKT